MAMEQALVLGTLAFSFPRDILDKIKSIAGVTDANMIYGPHDFYVLVKTETKEELRTTIVLIRDIEGVQSTMTSNVVSPPIPEGEPKE